MRMPARKGGQTVRTGGPATSVQVTVAVVSWNTRGLLSDCLESLREDARSETTEVCVVDNASCDGSAELVRERFPWVKLIASRENLGYGAAVNLVATQTQSEWLAAANADVRVARGALQRLLEDGARHPEAAVIAPRLILPDGATQRSAYPFPTIAFTLANAFGLLNTSDSLAQRWCIGRGFDPDHAREVPWTVGAFLLVRRSAWESVQGFDEQQWMYAEDVDLCWRLRRKGWSIRYQPAAQVIHVESAATRQAWGEQRTARWHASTYAWLARSRGFAVARLIAAINVLGSLIRAAYWAPGALMGSPAARRARREALNVAAAHSVGLRSRSLLRRVH